MFSLKQKWKALGQTAINSVNRDTANSASVPNASTQSLLEQALSINQQPSSEVFDMEFEAKDGDAEQSGNPANDSTSPSQSTTEHSTTRQPPTKPIDIKYFVPKNIEPEGLSQSVMISDYDYIHRQLVKRYKMNKAAGSTSQRTPLHQETVQESSNEELDYLSTDDEYNEEDSLSGDAAIANRLFSQSVPLLSSMSDYPRFAWSAITPPDHIYKTKNNTCSPLLHIKEGQYSSETEFKTNKDELDVSLDRDLGANVEQQAVSTDDEDLKEWMEAANECYGEVSEAEKKLFKSRLSAVNLETPWDRAHRNENAIEKLKKNEFIHLLFKRHSVPMKVTNIAQNVRFKQIQYHLHNPNILYMRYLRSTQTVFVIFRRYTEMMKAIDLLNCTRISGKTIVCRPSSYTEYDEACKGDLKRKCRRDKMKAAKKNSKSNKKARKPNRKYRKAAKQQRNSKQRRKQPELKTDLSGQGRSTPAYYYPCYCVQCTYPFLFSARK